ncbi:MAG: exosortase K [Saccharospirillaceae bacterium]|nr:exosortase K [Pseudomonadales bacterium]NRB77956.1 exosortase K [Saccharospirillaceae bacterium]
MFKAILNTQKIMITSFRHRKNQSTNAVNNIILNSAQWTILVVVICMFIGCKLFYRQATTQELIWLLMPVNQLIEWVTGFQSNYIINKGYYFQSIDMLINKSCSGFNLFLISMLIVLYLFFNKVRTIYQVILSVGVSVILAYVFVLITNCVRILNVMLIEHSTLFTLNANTVIHQSIGILVNVTFLVIFYMLIDKKIQGVFTNE